MFAQSAQNTPGLPTSIARLPFLARQKPDALPAIPRAGKAGYESFRYVHPEPIKRTKGVASSLLSGPDGNEFTDCCSLCANDRALHRPATGMVERLFCWPDFLCRHGGGAHRPGPGGGREEAALDSLWQPDRLGGRTGEEGGEGIGRARPRSKNSGGQRLRSRRARANGAPALRDQHLGRRRRAGQREQFAHRPQRSGRAEAGETLLLRARARRQELFGLLRRGEKVRRRVRETRREARA